MAKFVFSTSLSTIERTEWDDLVSTHPLGTVCHLSGYAEILYESLGFKPLFFRLYSEKMLMAIWPCSQAGFPFKSRLVSMPLYETGGPLYRDNITEIEISDFISKISEYIRTNKIKSIEYRAALGMTPAYSSQYFVEQTIWDYASLRLDSPDHLYKNIVNSQVRKAVAKARRNNLIVVEKHDEASIRDWFYPLYLQYMKNRHGSPPLPLEFFVGFTKKLKDVLRVFYVKLDEQIIAALLGYAVGKRIYISHAPTHPDYLKYRSSDLAHWAFIEWGADNGFDYFDFGNARYEGQRRFKAKWGCTFAPYKRYYLFANGSSQPPSILDPDGIKYQVASKIWCQFVPLQLTPFFGKWIHRVLGE